MGRNQPGLVGTPEIPANGRWRQKDSFLIIQQVEFKANRNYMCSCLKNNKTQTTRKNPTINELRNENHPVHDLFYITNLLFDLLFFSFLFWGGVVGVGVGFWLTLEMEPEASCILPNQWATPLTLSVPRCLTASADIQTSLMTYPITHRPRSISCFFETAVFHTHLKSCGFRS